MGCHGTWWQEILVHGLIPALTLFMLLRNKIKW
jgi:hypothetical protein